MQIGDQISWQRTFTESDIRTFTASQATRASIICNRMRKDG